LYSKEEIDNFIVKAGGTELSIWKIYNFVKKDNSLESVKNIHNKE
jgi:hypothetical protein